jgi:hypothetical protein
MYCISYNHIADTEAKRQFAAESVFRLRYINITDTNQTV